MHITAPARQHGKSHRKEHVYPFPPAGQMPPLGASSTDFTTRLANQPISATLSCIAKHRRRIHRGTPHIESPVLGAVARLVVVTETGRIQTDGWIVIGEIQIFGHPGLVANFYGLVRLTVARIRRHWHNRLPTLKRPVAPSRLPLSVNKLSSKNA